MDLNCLSYGEIIQKVNQVGLSLCNDLRLKEQLKNEKKFARHELENFCYQFGLEDLKNPSRKRKIKSRFQPKPKHSYYKRKSSSPPHKHFSKHSSKSKDKTKDFSKEKKGKIPTCYKCHKKGHFACNCNSKRVNEINEEENPSSDSDTEPEKQEFCDCVDCLNIESDESEKEVNVLSSDEQFMLDLIDDIQDPTLKKQKLV